MHTTGLVIVLQFQWPPPDVIPRMKKFEGVSSDHHQISLAGESPGLMSRG